MNRTDSTVSERQTPADKVMHQKQNSADSSAGSQVSAPMMLMQVHDSIMVECKKDLADDVSKMMIEVMENIKPDLGVNLKVDVSAGKNWGEL